MKMKHLLLMLSLPLLSMMSFVACSDSFTPEVVTPTHFTYNERIFNNANSLTYSLDSLGAPIVSIAGAPDWMETSHSLDSEEEPLLTVSY